MTPDSVDPMRMRVALEQARAAAPSEAIADETLALTIEEGIGALPLEQRATVLRAIGNDPALAAVVADLAAGMAGAAELRFLGVRREAWRAALAACAVLAVGAGTWMLLAPAQPAHPVQVLDSARGAVPQPEPSFAEWFGGAPLRTAVGVLAVLCGLLTIPSFWPVRPPAGRGPGGP